VVPAGKLLLVDDISVDCVIASEVFDDTEFHKVGVEATAFRTIHARPDPLSMIKPGELIDVIEMSPLTLTDRRIFNMLIENAWERSRRRCPPPDGCRFPLELRAIVRKSNVFARLKKDVIFALPCLFAKGCRVLIHRRHRDVATDAH
jgi:hypothetical protein